MNWDLNQFHFIRPLWLLAIPTFIILWLLIKHTYKNTHWDAHINSRMLEVMRIDNRTQSQIWQRVLLASWIICSLAVAGPAWQKQAVPSLQNQNAMVVILDLSVSMLAQDLSPDRLTQAKYKLIDILRARKDGQTGLIVYAGDAHTVSPLTDDPNAIEVLLPALHPNIMPTQGSNTESAVLLAMQLFDDSGIASGQILLLTDGITDSAQSLLLKQFDQRHQLSILSVGGAEAVPVPVEGGGFLRRSNGEIVLTAPNKNKLNKLAKSTGGRFSAMSLDSTDIEYLTNDKFDSNQSINTIKSSTGYDDWADMGHWLALLLLPIIALSFRRGVVYFLPLFVFLPFDSNAFEWQDLWQTPDQQAQQLIDQNPQAAAEKFSRQDWAGVANYQAKNYDAAQQHFSNSNDANSHYNRGNALAMNGDLNGAAKAYEQAIEQNPNFADAKFNKQLVEKLKKQQEEQQQNKSREDAEPQNSEQQEPEDQSQSSQQEEQNSDPQSSNPNQPSENQSNQQSNDELEPSADEEQPKNEEAPKDNEPSPNEEQKQSAEEGSEQKTNDEEGLEQQAMLSEATPDQLKDASEQWLRSINDDPSGLLRRKFQYQSWLQSREQTPSNTTINANEERY